MAVRGRAFLSEQIDDNRFCYNKGGLAPKARNPPICLMGYAASRLTHPTKKQDGERRQTLCSYLRARARHAPRQGRARLSAFHRGFDQGDFRRPRLSAPGHASGDSAGAHDPMDRQPGRRSCASPRVLPAPSCHRPAKHLARRHAGHSAGRNDARNRPRATVTSRRPREPLLAPPDGVTGRRPER
jgi:hypothetical protein